MGRLNTYLFKKASVAIGGLIVFACCVLLLERLLRIFEVVSNSTRPAGDASSMVLNLLPHYLGIAVPIALMLGTIITVDRFSRSSELTAALGAGISLTHMTKPFLLIAAILAGLTIFIEGWLQPVGRYNYRSLVNSVEQRSFTAALREGTFTTVGSRTFFAGTDKPSGGIGPIFIRETQFDENGEPMGFRLSTANEGVLIIREETGAPVLQLGVGQAYTIMEDTETSIASFSGDLGFDGTSFAGAATDIPFRARGDDERELTSVELFQNRNGNIRDEIDQNTNNAALHLRLARMIMLLIIPFIAVPFGLNYGRNPSSAGIFIGIVFLVSLQKGLEFAQSLGAAGTIAPWMGPWGLIAALAIFAAFIFRKSAFKMGQPPLTSFALWVAHMNKQVRQWPNRLRSQLFGAEQHG